MTDEKKPTEPLAFPNYDDVKIVGGMDTVEAFRITRIDVLKGIREREELNRHHEIPGLIASYNQVAKRLDQPLMDAYIMPRNPRKK